MPRLSHKTMALANRVNIEYMRLAHELFLLFALSLSRSGKVPAKPRSVLIVAPCLIGEFAMSIPAISDYIKRNPGAAVDIMVTPILKPLASRIRGIRNAYAVAAVYGREEAEHDSLPIGPYDLIIAIRMSRGAYNAVWGLKGAVRTSALSYARYALHLLASLVRRHTPKQWREFNFEVLGGVPHSIPFDEMLGVKPLPNEGNTKTILIHTGARWSMKRWDLDSWVALLKALNEQTAYKLVFIGSGEEDEADYRYIENNLPFKTESLINKLSVEQTVGLMRNANFFVGIDSGPANLARLAELPNITIYGPGPHMYMPYEQTGIALDKSRGRGFLQMFFAREGGYINRITVSEVLKAFTKLANKEFA